MDDQPSAEQRPMTSAEIAAAIRWIDDGMQSLVGKTITSVAIAPCNSDMPMPCVLTVGFSDGSTLTITAQSTDVELLTRPRTYRLSDWDGGGH